MRELALFSLPQRHVDIDRPLRAGASFQYMAVQPPLEALVPQIGPLPQHPTVCGGQSDLLIYQGVNPDIREEVEGPPGRKGLFGRGSRQGEETPGEIAGALVVNAVGKLPRAPRKKNRYPELPLPPGMRSGEERHPYGHLSPAPGRRGGPAKCDRNFQPIRPADRTALAKGGGVAIRTGGRRLRRFPRTRIPNRRSLHPRPRGEERMEPAAPRCHPPFHRDCRASACRLRRFPWCNASGRSGPPRTGSRSFLRRIPCFPCAGTALRSRPAFSRRPGDATRSFPAVPRCGRFQDSLVARLTLATGTPLGVYFTSGSEPRLPIRIALLTPPRAIETLLSSLPTQVRDGRHIASMDRWSWLLRYVNRSVKPGQEISSPPAICFSLPGFSSSMLRGWPFCIHQGYQVCGGTLVKVGTRESVSGQDYADGISERTAASVFFLVPPSRLGEVISSNRTWMQGGGSPPEAYAP